MTDFLRLAPTPTPALNPRLPSSPPSPTKRPRLHLPRRGGSRQAVLNQRGSRRPNLIQQQQQQQKQQQQQQQQQQGRRGQGSRLPVPPPVRQPSRGSQQP